MAPKVIMFCDDCTLYGVPVPENTDTCGNCGSHNVTVYYPAAQPSVQRIGGTDPDFDDDEFVIDLAARKGIEPSANR